MSIKRKRFILIILLFLVIVVFNIKAILRFVFPLKYENFILEYSSQYKVDPYLVAAVISTESKYNEKALSSKGAYGLMQIMPDTAQWISSYVELNPFNLDLLYNPEINIKMGCWYLDNLNKEFKGQTDLVLAAYNAGRGNVNKWLINEEYSKDGKSLYKVPFKETEEYIKKVKFSYKIYKILYQFET